MSTTYKKVLRLTLKQKNTKLNNSMISLLTHHKGKRGKLHHSKHWQRRDRRSIDLGSVPWVSSSKAHLTIFRYIRFEWALWPRSLTFDYVANRISHICSKEAYKGTCTKIFNTDNISASVVIQRQPKYLSVRKRMI